MSLAAAAAVASLCEVMDRLRSPGGCPWDAEQTHASLVEYLIEETFETVEAIDTGDMCDLREELGDLLLQIVFHCRIAEEDQDAPWGLAEVADGIREKLIRRHPHVFASETARDAKEVEHSWQARKAGEKGRASATDGVPMAMPSIQLAAKLIKRAERAGVDVSAGSADARSAARAAVAGFGNEAALGDFLIALVDAGTASGMDPDAALRSAVRRFREAVLEAEELLPRET